MRSARALEAAVAPERAGHSGEVWPARTRPYSRKIISGVG